MIFTFIDSFIQEKYQKHINKHLFFIMLFIEAYSTAKNDLFFLIFSSLLLINSITDYINNDVYTFFNILILITSLILLPIKISQALFSLLVPLFLFFLNKIFNGIGLGDIELLTCICFVFNLYELIEIIFLSSFLNLIYAFFTKKKYFAFVPFLTISILIFWLI